MPFTKKNTPRQTLLSISTLGCAPVRRRLGLLSERDPLEVYRPPDRYPGDRLSPSGSHPRATRCASEVSRYTKQSRLSSGAFPGDCLRGRSNPRVRLMVNLSRQLVGGCRCSPCWVDWPILFVLSPGSRHRAITSPSKLLTHTRYRTAQPR